MGRDADTAAALIQTRAERTGVDPIELTTALSRRGVPNGTPDQAAGAYAAIAEAGVTRVYLQLAGGSLEDVSRAVDAARRAVELAVTAH